jgi:hypothetical protein
MRSKLGWVFADIVATSLAQASGEIVEGVSNALEVE